MIPSCNDPFPLKPGDFIAVTLTASDDVKEKVGLMCLCTLIVMVTSVCSHGNTPWCHADFVSLL